MSRGDGSRSVTANHEQGSVTLFVVSCLALVLLLGAALGVVVAMVSSHRVAQSAADLAALAAAGARNGDPCAAGAAIARANGARQVSCRVEGRDVLVRVVVEGPGWLGQVGDLGAMARAGPA